MNDLKSIDEAVKIFKKYNINFALMHCTNLYPTPNHLTRLECIQLLKKIYPSTIIGYSDHTMPDKNMLVLTEAYKSGAQIIEKHFEIQYPNST